MKKFGVGSTGVWVILTIRIHAADPPPDCQERNRNTKPSASAISSSLLNSFTRLSANSAKQSFFSSLTLVLNYEAPRFDRSFILCGGCV